MPILTFVSRPRFGAGMTMCGKAQESRCLYATDGQFIASTNCAIAAAINLHQRGIAADVTWRNGACNPSRAAAVFLALRVAMNLLRNNGGA